METINLLLMLLRQARENPNSLSERLRGRVPAAQIYRFLSGETKNPRRSTLQPIADYYSVPVEAFYEPSLATKIMANLSKGASPMIGIDLELEKRADQVPVVPVRRVIAPPAYTSLQDRMATYAVGPVPALEPTKPKDPLANRRQYMTLDLSESLERFTDLKNLKIAYALAADAIDRHFESIKYLPEPDLFDATGKVDTPSPATAHPSNEVPVSARIETPLAGHQQTIL